MDGWYEEWFTEYKEPTLKKSSARQVRNKYYAVFSPYFGNSEIKSILNKDVQSAINKSVQKGVALSTIKVATRMLDECMESAGNNDFIRKNPCYGIVLPRVQEKKKVKCKYITQEQQDEFLKHICGHFYEELFYIMFLTGMRVGEVGGLLWSDINFGEKYIEVRRTLTVVRVKGAEQHWELNSPKTESSNRKIPFIGETETMLYRQLAKQNMLKESLGEKWNVNSDMRDFVFTTRTGSPVTAWTVNDIVKVIISKINKRREIRTKKGEEVELFPIINPHVIRHTFCSRCYEYGISPKVIQEVMGHAQYATTVNTYTHVTDNTIQTELEKFKSAIS